MIHLYFIIGFEEINQFVQFVAMKSFELPATVSVLVLVVVSVLVVSALVVSVLVVVVIVVELSGI